MTASGLDTPPRNSLRGSTRSTGEWHVYTAIYDHRRSEIYVDGPPPPPPSASPLASPPPPPASPSALARTPPHAPRPTRLTPCPSPLTPRPRTSPLDLAPPPLATPPIPLYSPRPYPPPPVCMRRLLRGVWQERRQQQSGRALDRLRPHWCLLPERILSGAPLVPLPHAISTAGTNGGRSGPEVWAPHRVATPAACTARPLHPAEQ